MKKCIAILSSLLYVCSFSACSKNIKTLYDDVAPGKTNQSESVGDSENTGIKLTSDIIDSTDFSEGLTLVKCKDNPDITICIDNNGYIVFEIPQEFPKGIVTSKFINGFILFKGNIYDKKGNMYTPENHGVTKFYDRAFKDNYIICEVVESSFDSTTKQLGIMNFDFDWIVKPNETLYKSIDTLSLGAANVDQDQYYFDGLIGPRYYNNDNEKHVDLKTGEISDNPPVNIPSFAWYNQFGKYFGIDGVMLDISEKGNVIAGECFINGKAPIVFYNIEVSESYFTVIDDKGNFSFEPIKIGTDRWYITSYDGINILISRDDIYKCFDTDGNLIGEKDFTSVSSHYVITGSVSDGIIRISKYNSSSGSIINFHTTSFEPLF